MSEFLKSTKGKIIIAILILALIGGGIAAYFFISKMVNDREKVVADPYLSAICRNRVQNAQYVPDVRKFSNESTANVNPGTSPIAQTFGQSIVNQSDKDDMDNLDKQITLDNFNKVIEEIGVIDSPFDREFSITDVKDEVYKVLANTSSFGGWFSSSAKELQGTGFYNINYDKDKDHITIIRLSGFQPWVYDSKTKKIIDNKDVKSEKDNYPCEEDVVYKIDYYYNEQGIEVVECEIVSFLNYYEKTYVSQYQYVKNVKDTSFTKYIITPNLSLMNEAQDGGWGYDIDTQNELGTMRKFIQMNYTDKDDVSMIFINQAFASAYNNIKNTTQIKFYKKIKDEIYLYNSAYSYCDSNDENYDIGYYHFLINTIRNTYDNKLFDYYLNEYFVSAVAQVGTPDTQYATRSASTIGKMYREMYYTDGTNSLYITPGSYYLKQNNDNASCFYKLQSLPNLINQSISFLGQNTQLTIIDTQVAKSPKYIDISDQTSKNEYELFIDDYLKVITQNIVSKSYLKNNYISFDELSKRAANVEGSDTSGIKDYVSLEDFENTSSISGTVLTYSASAKVTKTLLLKDKNEYQLCVIAKGDGNNFVILKNGISKKYESEDMTLNIEGTLDLTSFKTSIEDNYIIGVAMLMKYDDKTILCSDIKALTFATQTTIQLPKNTYKGFEVTYTTKYENSNLIISTKAKDIEAPKIEANSSITLTVNSKVGDLMKKIKITDNGKLAMIEVYKNNVKINDYTTVLSAGDYVIKAKDNADNIATKTVTVVIE